MKQGKSLTKKFILGFVIVGVILGIISVLLGYQSYANDIARQYHDTADMIADTVENYLSEDTLEEYVQAAKSGDSDTISMLENSEEYQHIRNQINELRKSMQLNDIYVVYYTPEEMCSYQGSREDWEPLLYIFDCYAKEEEAYHLGDRSSMNPDNRELFAEVPATKKKQEDYIISNGDFGYNTSALLPVLSEQGDVIAIIGVEMPMKRLENCVKKFVISTFSGNLAAMFLVMVIFVFYLYRKVIVPIEVIAGEAKAFGEQGDAVSEKLSKIQTGDEIEKLAQNILQMEKDIINYVENITKITAEKERISAELSVATEIQASMLPVIFPIFPEHEEFDVYATMTPAKEVGGDFYDIFMVDETHLAIVVADVSGKGVPAALFMVIGKTLIKDHTVPGVDIGSVFSKVNNLLCESNSEELFITAFEGVLDLVTGEFTYVNAGHEPPFISRGGEKFEAFRIKPALVLAAISGMKYQYGSIMLNPGDKVFQYTDGVTEATNAREELYGMERLEAVLERVKGEAPTEILKEVKADVDRFVGEAPQFDDITMLCLQYRKRMENGKAV